MTHAIYENFVIENKVANFMDTKLAVSPFYTHDISLAQAAGMKKTVNVYTATGDVRDVAMGEGNQQADDVTVSFTPVDYTVKYCQGRFPYYDEEVMKDPNLVNVGLEKMSANMVNDLTKKFYAELGKATQIVNIAKTAAITFNDIVDATAKFGENEDSLFLLINPDEKAAMRKSLKDELKYVEGFVRTGYIGSVNNVPVYTSDAVPDNRAYLASKEAVTIFTKKEIETEQERDADKRQNIIYNRRCNVVALTDTTKVVEIIKAEVIPTAGLAIAGVTAPVKAATPVTKVTDTDYYTGTVVWTPALDAEGKFKASTAYTATITLTPKKGYYTVGVAANSYTVDDATVTNGKDGNVATAVFSATLA